VCIGLLSSDLKIPFEKEFRNNETEIVDIPEYTNFLELASRGDRRACYRLSSVPLRPMLVLYTSSRFSYVPVDVLRG